MNLPGWSCPASPCYPPNYYSYLPYSTGAILNSTFQTSLNSSSGYESLGNETSFVDPYVSSPTSLVKEYHMTVSKKRPLEDSDADEFDDGIDDDENQHARKKRRVLSRPQRQEANRRERQRMEIINHAYEELRNALPFKKGRKRQKMSRMDTVEGAIRYIHSLLEMLHGPNYDPHWAD